MPELIILSFLAFWLRRCWLGTERCGKHSASAIPQFSGDHCRTKLNLK